MRIHYSATYFSSAPTVYGAPLPANPHPYHPLPSPLTPRKPTSPPPLPHPKSKITPRRRRHLVHTRPPIPERALPLHDRDDLVRDPPREIKLAGPFVRLLARRVQYPFECLSAPLTHAQRDGDLQRCAAACCAALGADAEEGRQGVEGER